MKANIFMNIFNDRKWSFMQMAILISCFLLIITRNVYAYETLYTYEESWLPNTQNVMLPSESYGGFDEFASARWNNYGAVFNKYTNRLTPEWRNGRSDIVGIINSSTYDDYYDLCGLFWGASTVAISRPENLSCLPFSGDGKHDIAFNSGHSCTANQECFSDTALHELGHSIGIGHNPSIESVMNFDRPASERMQLYPDDVKYIYEIFPNSSNSTIDAGVWSHYVSGNETWSRVNTNKSNYDIGETGEVNGLYIGNMGKSGSALVNLKVKFILDDDGTPDTSDIVVGTIAFSGPFPGATGDSYFNLPFTIPNGVSAGIYSLYAIVFADGSSFDSYSFNNDAFIRVIEVNPPPVTLTSLAITGATSVNESSNAQYTATATFSDNSTQTVTSPSTWSENSGYSTISSSGYLTTSSVSSDQSVIITASYTTGGVTKSDTHAVTIINQVTTPTLTSLVIEGINSVDENTNTQYNARAYFSDGSNQFVTTSSSWSDNSNYASISNSGVLSTTSVSSDQQAIITASYTTGGVIKSDTHTVTIINQVTAPTLTSLTISGATSVNESSNAQYTATATFSDGSTQTVTSPTNWSENSAYATISSSGLLTTSSVSSDQSVTLTASYMAGGVTKSDTHNVTILNQLSSCTYTIISPNGGENWIAGSTHTIEWSKSGNNCGSSVRLVLGKNDIFQYFIDSSAANTGSYTWLISNTQTVGSDYTVHLSDISSGAYYEDLSNEFTISTPTEDLELLNDISQTHTLTSTAIQQNWKYFYVDLDNDTDEINFDLTNLTGDFDLYVRAGVKPTLDTYDCRPWLDGLVDENCIQTNPVLGRWWVGVLNYNIGTYSFTVNASWVDASPVLTSLTISGATSVNENSNAQYTATATFSDNSTQTVTSPSTWSENSGYATINSSGLLTTSSVSSNQTVIITASYSTGGVTRSDTHTVTIINLPADIELINNISQNHTLISTSSQQSWKYFYVDLDSGTENLSIDLINLAADLDLFVKFGSKPTINDYDCVSWDVAAVDENCTQLNPAIGRWWIGVNNFDVGTHDYTINASWVDENNIIFADGFDNGGQSNQTLIINEIRYDIDDDLFWIELLNLSNTPIPILDWELNIGGGSKFTFPDWLDIQPNAFFLFSFSGWSSWSGDYNGGQITLVEPVNSQAVDFLRWGNSNANPSHPGTSWSGVNLPTPLSNGSNSLGRKPNNTDTNNSSDWCLMAASPHVPNSSCN